jgi:DNA primase
VEKYKNHSGNFQAPIPAELIEAVRMLSPIEQVVSEHVKLRRSGAELIGRCPFHGDKKPSLSVNPGKGVFLCHGCGAAGDVYQFIELVFKCGFREAVRHLAERAGITLETFKPSPELTAKVRAATAKRKEREQFERFCRERIEAINRHYRALARAAGHAETCLRAGESDPYIHDLAWTALERFRAFEARIEREGLCDLDILRAEWSKREAA